MKEFKKILFPVDLSEVSPTIAPWVLDVAKRYDAEIHLLFVARKLEHLSSIDVGLIEIQKFQAEVVKGGELSLEEFADTNFKEKPPEKTSVVLGDAAEEIIGYVKSEEIDLVIMGTHGRKGLEKVILGSVADKVVKACPTPVLTINPYRTRES